MHCTVTIRYNLYNLALHELKCPVCRPVSMEQGCQPVSLVHQAELLSRSFCLLPGTGQVPGQHLAQR